VVVGVGDTRQPVQRISLLQQRRILNCKVRD
jgi:hypothetical protein